MINLIHVQEGLVGGTKTITQGLGEENYIQTVSPFATFFFYHNWSYWSIFEVILVGLETRLPYPSNCIWHAF